LAVNGNKVNNSKHLARQIAALAPGSRIDVKILRAQKEQSIQVKLGQMPSSQEIGARQPPFGRQNMPTELQQLGLTVSPPTGPNREGVVVNDVDPASDAAQKIRTGDVILEISGNPVRSADDLINAVREANRLQRRSVLLRVRSGSETRFVAVRLPRS
jgi:serine protease Do